MKYVVSLFFASISYFLITLLTFFYIFVMFIFLFCICFLFHVFRVFVLFCLLFFVLFLLLYTAVSFLFVYKSTDHCHWVETQLQHINIISYDAVYSGTSVQIFQSVMLHTPSGMN